VTAAERAAVEPPKLGKLKFEAAPVAVLTSDEVTGSLRQIKVRPLGHAAS
jgi:nucleolar protein 53